MLNAGGLAASYLIFSEGLPAAIELTFIFGA